ncbi:hypothetical protein [Oceanobacillus iheyensis HTE831]|uniref:Uncharacterized protein n=1 Tax=Oceanobacillus iheyensis (strain DSM 14371 / CIP 107618 / JCM 11309 / KCTC 3954 / HTE831) TaxID=221109 RepID=Q8ETU6_OCEIH|nr:hypothetical protein [Oceanobacillus iheyensis]BAC12115.1 hypothetical protein [Oceanobacillus iheyensis HTE831]
MENIRTHKGSLYGVVAAALVLGIIGFIGSPFAQGDILMILENAGYNIPTWAANSLTTIGGVYGAQQYLIGLLGVSVPWFLAAAVAVAGSAGV